MLRVRGIGAADPAVHILNENAQRLRCARRPKSDTPRVEIKTDRETGPPATDSDKMKNAVENGQKQQIPFGLAGQRICQKSVEVTSLATRAVNRPAGFGPKSAAARRRELRPPIT
jgi:hypothetical protein